MSTDGRPIPRERLRSPLGLPYGVNLGRKVYTPHVWTAVPRHPSIEAQPSEGRKIKFMHPYEGVVLVGYGDWNANTGPMDVVGYDEVTGDPVTFLTGAPTEAFERIREIDGSLYLLWVDPLGADNVGGFTTNEGGAWHNVVVGPMIHTFDMIEWGGDLYVSGSAMYDANAPGGATGEGVVYRREGSAWVKAHVGIEHAPFTRFYRLWVDEQGRLCTEEEVSSGVWRTWRTPDGVAWVADTPGLPVYGANFADRGRWVAESAGTPYPFNSFLQPLPQGLLGCITENYLWTYDSTNTTIYRTPLLL